jgi:hypothetical protein
MTVDELLTDEARAAVLRALFMIVVNDNEPASARVAAARLFLSQFDEQPNADQSVMVIVDEAAFVKTV